MTLVSSSPVSEENVKTDSDCNSNNGSEKDKRKTSDTRQKINCKLSENNLTVPESSEAKYKEY